MLYHFVFNGSIRFEYKEIILESCFICIVTIQQIARVCVNG